LFLVFWKFLPQSWHWNLWVFLRFPFPITLREPQYLHFF
jgi:hypothetical protein